MYHKKKYMKSTHILVPNKEYYRNLLILKNDPPDEVIEVDLSEEGIKDKASFHYPAHNDIYDESNYDAGGYNGYRLCAKDILNHK